MWNVYDALFVAARSLCDGMCWKDLSVGFELSAVWLYYKPLRQLHIPHHMHQLRFRVLPLPIKMHSYLPTFNLPVLDLNQHNLPSLPTVRLSDLHLRHNLHTMQGTLLLNLRKVPANLPHWLLQVILRSNLHFMPRQLPSMPERDNLHTMQQSNHPFQQ